MSVKAVPQPLELLLVEDSAVDIKLTRRALRGLFVDSARGGTQPLQLNLHVAINGMEAMTFLRNPDKPTPHLVLLDIKMPLMNGWEVLAAMKSDEALRRIPVVILTTSNDDEDIFRSRDLHANGYVIKPVPRAHFEQAIESINKFWIQTQAHPG